MSPHPLNQPARLVHLVEGRSKQVFKTWLDGQSDEYRQRVSIVAMDGLLRLQDHHRRSRPRRHTIMDRFHVVALTGDKLNSTRQRVQHELTGERSHRNDPLYNARHTLRTGRALQTDKQKTRLNSLCEGPDSGLSD